MQEARVEAHFCRPGTIPAVVKVLCVLSIGKNYSNTNTSQKTIKRKEPSTNTAKVFACRSFTGFPLSPVQQWR